MYILYIMYMWCSILLGVVNVVRWRVDEDLLALTRFSFQEMLRSMFYTDIEWSYRDKESHFEIRPKDSNKPGMSIYSKQVGINQGRRVYITWL